MFQHRQSSVRGRHLQKNVEIETAMVSSDVGNRQEICKDEKDSQM